MRPSSQPKPGHKRQSLSLPSALAANLHGEQPDMDFTQVTSPSALGWKRELTPRRGVNMQIAGVAPGPSSPHYVPPGHTSVPLPLYARRPLCKPLQLINLQEADSKIDQWKKMGAGTGRGAHSPGHEQTVRIHSAAVNLQPHPNQFSLPLGMSTPGLVWKSVCCEAIPQHAEK